MPTGEQGVYGQDNHSQSTMYFLLHQYSIIVTLTSYHTFHCDKMRSLKICWCRLAALCLSPMALRMWSRGMVSFYLGITMSQTVCI